MGGGAQTAAGFTLSAFHLGKFTHFSGEETELLTQAGPLPSTRRLNWLSEDDAMRQQEVTQAVTE